VNIDEVLAVYNFIYEPNWSGVLNALEDVEDNDVAAALQVAAGHGVGKSPVRVEGYAEFVVIRYTEEAFKEHFRMNQSTFTVCEQQFYFSFFCNLNFFRVPATAVTYTCRPSSNTATSFVTPSMSVQWLSVFQCLKLSEISLNFAKNFKAIFLDIVIKITKCLFGKL